MEKTVLVWQTTCDTFSYVKNNIGLFIRALAIPFIILCISSIPFMISSATSIPFPGVIEPPIGNPFSPWLGLAKFLGTLLIVWIVNTCYRLAIKGEAGYRWWTMRETWTLIWMFITGIITTVCAAIPSLIIYFGLSMVGYKLAGLISACFIYTLIIGYLFGRLCVIFPSIAAGEMMTLAQTWKLTENNGWRIVILLGLIPVILLFVGFIIMEIITAMLTLLPVSLLDNLFMLSSLIFSFAVVCASSTALGLVYKQLK